MAVVFLLLVCRWISIINAQPVSLLPQDQTICRGESISFNCIGSGTGMILVSPPVVNETNSISVLPTDPVQTCDVVTNSAAAIVLVDSMESLSRFMGTFTLYISAEQSEGQRTVSCRVSSADGMVTRNDTTFFVGSPSPITSDSLNPQVLGYSSETVSVNLSWDSPDNAQEFMLQIMNSRYSTTNRTLESSITVQLPYGTYTATLCAINRCGQECRNYSNIDIVRVEPPQTSQPPQPPQPSQPPEEDNNDSLVIAPAVVAGVLGLLFIVTFIYAIAVTVMFCISKKDKLSAQTIPADEMKMK